MVTDRIDIKALNLDELAGVVNIYPWYAGARKELCRRMAEIGEGAWSDKSYAEAALYVGSRGIIAALSQDQKKFDGADPNIKELVSNYIGVDEESGEETVARRVFVVGGDYFSQSDYDGVRKSDDNVFSKFASKAMDEGFVYQEPEETADFCTETLAQIYLEQEYYEQAMEIYSKLSLRYPEKSAYFAALIEKIKNR